MSREHNNLLGRRIGIVERDLEEALDYFQSFCRGIIVSRPRLSEGLDYPAPFIVYVSWSSLLISVAIVQGSVWGAIEVCGYRYGPERELLYKSLNGSSFPHAP